MKTIVRAAIKTPDGEVTSLPKPGRHFHIIRALAHVGYEIPIKGEQGFITSDGEFVDRKEAFEIATQAQQILAHRKTGNLQLLFSEDVW